MDDALQLMARAMRDKARASQPKVYSILAGMREDEWLPLAQAALAALAIPTPAMTAAGTAAIDYAEDGGLLGGADELAYDMWREMVRAGLTEGKSVG